MSMVYSQMRTKMNHSKLSNVRQALHSVEVSGLHPHRAKSRFLYFDNTPTITKRILLTNLEHTHARALLFPARAFTAS